MTSANILIIDDEEVFREDLASLLRDEGLACRTARTGEAGLSLAAEDPPDVVLCDLMMPGIDGIETTDRMVSLCPSTSAGGRTSPRKSARRPAKVSRRCRAATCRRHCVR